MSASHLLDAKKQNRLENTMFYVDNFLSNLTCRMAVKKPENEEEMKINNKMYAC